MNALHCLPIEEIEKSDDVDKEARKKELNYPGKVVSLPSNPTHLGLNSDETTLAVCVKIKQIPHIYLFDTRHFLESGEIKPFLEIPGVTPPGVSLKELAWNPVLAYSMALVFTNGMLAMYLVKTDGSKFDVSTLYEGISCVSWSPKGKQLVAGKTNGKLTQYKPDLAEAKTMEPPGTGFSALSILWISTYQFLVCYGNGNERPGLFLAQGSKTGPTTFINYDDICYSTGEQNPAYFSMIQIPDWSLIISGSHNAMEIGVIGSEDAGKNWLQWLLPDSGRAELPLKSNNDERYPVGMALALCSSRKLPLEENNFMPFSMPILFTLSEDGLLCGFYSVNQRPNAAQVTKIEAQPNLENVRKGIVNVPTAVPKNLIKQLEAPPAFSTSFTASTPIKPALPNPPLISKPPGNFRIFITLGKPFFFHLCI